MKKQLLTPRSLNFSFSTANSSRGISRAGGAPTIHILNDVATVVKTKSSFAFSIYYACLLALFGCGGNGGYESDPGINEVSSLGRQIFFDQSLSNPPGVACSSCHSPEAAFSDPAHGSVSKGAVSGVTAQHSRMFLASKFLLIAS